MATLFAKMTDSEYHFSLRRHLQPKEISNLWELRIQTPNDKEPFVLVDADTLSTCLGKIQQVFELDGH